MFDCSGEEGVFIIVGKGEDQLIYGVMAIK